MEHAVEQLGMGAAMMAVVAALSLVVVVYGHFGSLFCSLAGNLQKDPVVVLERGYE